MELPCEIKCCASRKSKTCKNSHFPSPMQALLIPQSTTLQSCWTTMKMTLSSHQLCEAEECQPCFKQRWAEVGGEVGNHLPAPCDQCRLHAPKHQPQDQGTQRPSIILQCVPMSESPLVPHEGLLFLMGQKSNFCSILPNLVSLELSVKARRLPLTFCIMNQFATLWQMCAREQTECSLFSQLYIR